MTDHQRIVKAFCDAYERHVGTKYPFNGGKDGKLLKDLLAIYPPDQLETFIAAFFEMDDEFFADAGHSLGVFRSCLPKVIAYVNKGSRPSVPKPLQGIARWVQNPRAVNE